MLVELKIQFSDMALHEFEVKNTHIKNMLII